MTKTNKISRRSMLTASAGLAATAVSGTTIGKSMTVTPANPEGPFYPKHKQVDKDTDLTLIEGHTERAQGEVIKVTGHVLDDKGLPVEGALVDIWQANAHGRYHHEDDPATAPTDPNFQGWGMVKTDAEGRYAFTTIKPSAYMVDDKWSRPPHIHYKVSRRGYKELITQMYFDGDPLNDKDRLFKAVPEGERKHLLVTFSEQDVPEGEFNIVLGSVGTA